MLKRWTKGSPWQEGTFVYAPGHNRWKLHNLIFVATNVIPNREIEHVPVSRFMKWYPPREDINKQRPQLLKGLK